MLAGYRCRHWCLFEVVMRAGRTIGVLYLYMYIAITRYYAVPCYLQPPCQWGYNLKLATPPMAVHVG